MKIKYGTIQEEIILYAAEYAKKKKLNNIWPKHYRNKESGKIWKPLNEDMRLFVELDTPKYVLLKAGEGSGKTSSSIIKTLNRLRRGCSGIMASTNFEHFKKSLWPEFVKWCPTSVIIETHRYKVAPDHSPSKTFELVFRNEIGGYSKLVCGGFKEDSISSWEGTNVNFIYFDEARRHKTDCSIKILGGRVRLTGPNGEPAQFYFATTPRKNWLFDYFGPLKEEDKYADFKSKSKTYTASVYSNDINLDENFIDDRKATLIKESDRAIIIDGEWADETSTEKFINIGMWDNCKISDLPFPNNVAVLALDGSKGSDTVLPDCFAMVLVSKSEGDLIDINYVDIYEPQKGELFNWQIVTEKLDYILKTYEITQITYDPYQLSYLASTYIGANFQEFNQIKERQLADLELLNLILDRRIRHAGDETLRKHLNNAHIKKYQNDNAETKIKIVKESRDKKVDYAVALSMGCHRLQYYNNV